MDLYFHPCGGAGILRDEHDQPIPLEERLSAAEDALLLVGTQIRDLEGISDSEVWLILLDASPITAFEHLFEMRQHGRTQYGGTSHPDDEYVFGFDYMDARNAVRCDGAQCIVTNGAKHKPE